MYETPKLNLVGNAEDVILGIIPTGNDIDGTWIGGSFEFALEFDCEEDKR